MWATSQIEPKPEPEPETGQPKQKLSLYERPPPVLNNPVTKRLFAQLGRCLGFEARPAVVHFGGFQLGSLHTQYVKIMNVSSSAKRLCIINPTTKEFRVRVEKRGIVSPGLAEVLAIDFEPTERRYHFDCIRIFTEADNLLIPIHAYPVLNKVQFPSRLDFGEVALRDTRRKVLRLGCDVPIQFEFRLDVTKNHPDFRVSPLSGFVPPSGSVEITVDFAPLSFGTCLMELTLHVSQYSFVPMVCAVSGGCAPGMVRAREIAAAATRLVGARGDDMSLGMSSTLSPTNFGMNLTRTGPRGDRSAAVHTAVVDLIDSQLSGQGPQRPKGVGSGSVFDGGADLMSSSAISAARQRGAEPRWPEPAEVLVEGVMVPTVVAHPFAVNYVLTQQPGKLKPKALAAAVAAKRAQRLEQLAEQEALRATTGKGGGLTAGAIEAEEAAAVALRGKASGRQVRESAFLQDLSDLDQATKAREFKSSAEAVGGILLLPEEIDAVVAQRERIGRRAAMLAREAGRASRGTLLLGPNADKEAGRARAGRLTLNAGEAPPATQSIAAAAAPPPSFDLYEARAWSMRRGVAERFIYLVGTWIVQRRAARRLSAIWSRLGSARTRQEVRALVEVDNQALGPKPGEAGGLRFELLRFEPSLFPTFAEESTTLRAAVAATPTGPLGFDDRRLLGLRAAPEAELMGYAEVLPPPVNSFAPRRGLEGLRVGALEERGVRPPRTAWAPPDPPALTDAAAAYRALAQGTGSLQPPPCASTDGGIGAFDAAALYSADQAPLPPSTLCPPPTFVAVALPMETDPGWLLRPQAIPYHAPATYGARLASSVGSSALHAYAGVATLSTAWRPRRQRRTSGLACLEPQHRSWLWQHDGLPALQSKPDRDDAMSDSESDDDGDNDVITLD